MATGSAIFPSAFPTNRYHVAPRQKASLFVRTRSLLQRVSLLFFFFFFFLYERAILTRGTKKEREKKRNGDV